MNDAVGFVNSWEMVTSVDGPGTRLVVFLSGCPLRCLYCHNPETRYSKYGTKMLASVLIDKFDRYFKVFEATGGGVTFSGGEALMQPAFLKVLIDAAYERGINITLDTSGYGGKFLDDETLGKIDLVLLDVKSGSEEVYKKITKKPLKPTLDFFERLERLKIKTWVRFVSVPSLTDDLENVANVCKIVETFRSCVEKVEVLPFHQMGKQKWADLGLVYTLDKTPTPSEESLASVRQIFKDSGFKVN